MSANFPAPATRPTPATRPAPAAGPGPTTTYFPDIFGANLPDVFGARLPVQQHASSFVPGTSSAQMTSSARTASHARLSAQYQQNQNMPGQRSTSFHVPSPYTVPSTPSASVVSGPRLSSPQQSQFPTSHSVLSATASSGLRNSVQQNQGQRPISFHASSPRPMANQPSFLPSSSERGHIQQNQDQNRTETPATETIRLEYADGTPVDPRLLAAETPIPAVEVAWFAFQARLEAQRKRKNPGGQSASTDCDDYGSVDPESYREDQAVTDIYHLMGCHDWRYDGISQCGMKILTDGLFWLSNKHRHVWYGLPPKLGTVHWVHTFQQAHNASPIVGGASRGLRMRMFKTSPIEGTSISSPALQSHSVHGQNFTGPASPSLATPVGSTSISSPTRQPYSVRGQNFTAPAVPWPPAPTRSTSALFPTRQSYIVHGQNFTTFTVPSSPVPVGSTSTPFPTRQHYSVHGQNFAAPALPLPAAPVRSTSTSSPTRQPVPVPSQNFTAPSAPISTTAPRPSGSLKRKSPEPAAEPAAPVAKKPKTDSPLVPNRSASISPTSNGGTKRKYKARKPVDPNAPKKSKCPRGEAAKAKADLGELKMSKTLFSYPMPAEDDTSDEAVCVRYAHEKGDKKVTDFPTNMAEILLEVGRFPLIRDLRYREKDDMSPLARCIRYCKFNLEDKRDYRANEPTMAWLVAAILDKDPEKRW
ncbi:hypothetical protein BU16DRAFT_588730 [Lophium mytilinum]|uniref:Uncharacterized protein n=1 Tax=Lophium mytilinum TaxID=390894 RepID=A0A6A6REG2_9PEZI|nr:hypothetical protein BU16DRAFT_588730 [Lophium mytilinum]